MPRKYERKVGGSLLSGDLLSMLGGPSIGMTKMPLESLFDAALGKGAFENFRNTGTKMLLDTVVKGATDGALKNVIGKGRPRKHKVLKACHHKHQNKCKCPSVEGGAGPMDFLHALDLPNTSQKLANSALEVLMKRILAGGSQPYDAPLMLGPRMIGGHWYDYINPAWYFKKTMQKVVEPVLHATHIDRVVNAIPGVNLVAALTGATKMHGAPPPAAAAPAATKPTGAGRSRGRPRKVKVIGDDNILVQDLEGGAIPNFEQMSVAKLRKIYRALDDHPQETKDQLIEAIVPYFTPEVPRGRPRTRTPAMSQSPSRSPSPAPTGSGRKSKAKPKDAAYYRERYARRKAKKEMKVKVI